MKLVRLLEIILPNVLKKIYSIINKGDKMSKNKYCSYENAKTYLYDKDKYINTYIDNMFNRTQKMFEWKNLPDTIPQREIEYMLQRNGNVFITKVNGDLYALNGGLGGELNEYYEPTLYTVSNPYLKLSKNFIIDTDGVLVRNDARMTGLLPIFSKASVLNCDCEISLSMLSIALRVQYLISASDDKTRNNADIFMSKIKNGDMSIISDSQFFDGVKLQSTTSNNQIINQFIQLSQYIKASAFNEIGLNANFNMKKERLITSEISVNESSLLPMVENMEYERKNAVEKINKMFNTNIEVNLSCVWKEQSDIHEKNIIKNNKDIENGDIASSDRSNDDSGNTISIDNDVTETTENENL